MQNLCFIVEFYSHFSKHSCIWMSTVMRLVFKFLDLNSSNAGHQQKLLALCNYMHSDLLFTNKAHMNKVLIQ